MSRKRRARSSASVGRPDRVAAKGAGREAQTPVRGAVTPGGPRRLQLRFAPEGVAPSAPRGRRSPNAGAPHDSRGAEARFRHRETATLPTVVGNIARGLEGRPAVTGEMATKSFV